MPNALSSSITGSGIWIELIRILPNRRTSTATAARDKVSLFTSSIGVNAAHQEFASASGQASRVSVGYNATTEDTFDEDGSGEIDTGDDYMPANDPCFGFAEPAIYAGDDANYRTEVIIASHGTAVASILGGTSSTKLCWQTYEFAESRLSRGHPLELCWL